MLLVLGTALVMMFLLFMFIRPSKATLRSGEVKYSLDIAASESVQQRGLGSKQTLARDEGMLFVFNKPSVRCMWMKDMRFPIDIIWLDSAKKVTYIAANVAPETYPEQYCGDASTKYVVELKAGEAKRTGIDLGKTLKF